MKIAPLSPFIPDDYLIELGRITALWASFEGSFDAMLSLLMTGRRPHEFRRRAETMKKAARESLVACHSLVAKIEALCDRASNLAGKRAELIHGHWFYVDKFFSPKEDPHCAVSTSWDGGGQSYKVRLPEMQKLAAKIRKVSSDLIMTLPPPGIETPLLTSQEKHAWRDYRETRPTASPPTPRSKPLLHHTWRG